MSLDEFWHDWDWISFNELLTIHVNAERRANG